jgi:hypothetical protein
LAEEPKHDFPVGKRGVVIGDLADTRFGHWIHLGIDQESSRYIDSGYKLAIVAQGKERHH